MRPLLARYPFLPAAREAVERADIDLAEVVAREAPVLARARERVELAIESRTIGEPHRSNRVEVLSYPVARVLVSLVDEPALTRRYASAEAETAVRRLRADADESTRLQSVADERISLADFLAGLGLAGDVREADGEAGVKGEGDGDGEGAGEAEGGRGNGNRDRDRDRDRGGGAAGGRGESANGYEFAVAVGTYLRLSAGLDGDRWRLVNRALAGGSVPVSEDELYDLLRGAVRDRVARDLPLSVPDAVAASVAGTVDDLRDLLSDFDVDRDIDAVEPSLFPPCVQALADRVGAGGPLPDHSRFAYVAFLSAIGMDPGEVADRLSAHPDVDAAEAAYEVDHVADGGGAAYPPPSCATMQAYGDCVNQDSVCATIAHPLEYYEKRLDGAVPGGDQASRPESQ